MASPSSKMTPLSYQEEDGKQSNESGGSTQQPSKNSVSPNSNNAEEEEEDNNDDDDTLMVCRCDTPKLLVDLLQAFSKTGLSHKSSKGSMTAAAATQNNGTAATQTTSSNNNNKSTPMTIFCAPNGITFHQQSSNKQFQASMELPSSFFGHYEISGGDEDNDSTEPFTIHWNTLLQCLGVLLTTSSSAGNNFHPFFNPNGATQTSTLTLAYHTSTELLRLEWETTSSNSENPIMATAAIPGLEGVDDECAELSGAFASSKIQARWLSSSKNFKEAKSELEHVPGATMVQISFHRNSGEQDDDEYDFAPTQSTQSPSTTPMLRLVTKGHSSAVTVDIPGTAIEFSDDDNNEDDDDDDNDKISYTYSLQHWKQAMAPLDMAQETCLSVNEKGIFAVQHQLCIDSSKTNDADSQAFCDFLLLPMVEQLTDDDEESGEEEEDSDDEKTQSATRINAVVRAAAAAKHQESDNDNDDSDDTHSSQMMATQEESRMKKQQHRRNRPEKPQEQQRRGTRLPIGSDDDDEDTDHDDEQEQRKVPGMLFPTLDQRHNHHGGSPSQASSLTLSQSVVDNNNRQQRRRDERKRQRRASLEHSNRRRHHQQEQEDNDDDDDDSTHAAPSPNLLADTPESTQSKNHRQNDDDDQDYPSSPEIVYGEG